ncbi:MAG: hypothetical protein M9899_10740 [Bdellovibrionaceae bacterium]|nr:hypothetical protein [Pseudobdellovibrionaceae bacterium]
MIFKKALVWIALLVTVLTFQNCEFQSFDSSEVERKEVTSVDHFSVDIKEHPHVLEGYQYTTQIRAQLDVATGIDGHQIVAKDKFIITKQTSDTSKNTCTTSYSVSRDEIRTLLKDIEDARVVKALKSSDLWIADAAIYTLSVNHETKILLSNKNYQAGDLYTTDIQFSDFEKLLQQLEDNIIAKNCEDVAIDSFAVTIKEHPHVMTGHKYTSFIKASLDSATGVDGKVILIKNQFLITREEIIAGKGTCAMSYSVSRDDLSSVLKKIKEAKINFATKPSEINGADMAIYTLQVDKGPVILLSSINYNKGDHYTTDIGLKDFSQALDSLSHKVIFNGCADEK